MQSIINNISSQFTNRQLNINTKQKGKISEKLSSGYKINRSADNAAGLSISEEMRSQIRGLKQGSRNSDDGISLLQVADGALDEVQDILIRISELSTQSANDTNTVSDRQNIQDEINALCTEINKIGTDTEFNTKKLFNSGYVVDSDYADITDPDIEPDFDESAFLTSIEISGTPTDTSILNYNMRADEIQGITINGTRIPWTNVTTSSGNDLTSVPINQGTYSFEFNGINVAFDVNIDTELSDIASALDGVSFSFNSSRTSNYVTSAVGNDNGSVVTSITKSDYLALFQSGTHNITVDSSNNVSITNNANGESFSARTYRNSETGKNAIICNNLDIALTEQSGSTLQDRLNALNGATFETNGPTYVKGTGYYNQLMFSNSSVVPSERAESRITTSNLSLGLVDSLGYDSHNLYSEHVGDDNITANFKHTGNVPGIELQSTGSGANVYFALDGDSRSLYNSLINTAGTAGTVYNFKFVNGSSNINYSLTLQTDTGNVSQFVDMAFQLNTAHPIDDYSLNMQTVTMFDVTNIRLGDSSRELFTQDGEIKKNGQNLSDLISATNGNKGQWWIQSGSNTKDGFYITIGDMNTKLLGIDTLNVLSHESSGLSIEKASKALNTVSKQRARIGAQQNRLEYAKSIADNSAENLQESESKIRDADISSEMVAFANTSILAEAGQSMLAQANQSTQGVLQLLQ